MLKHDGNNLGDSWYFEKDGIVHCYYLTCPNTVERHTAWDIAHATSSDLINWDLHGIVIERGSDEEWDGICLATGSVIEHDGKYWLAYTARWNEPSVSVGLATSDDLYTWTKVEYNPITTTDTRFYEGIGSRNMAHWRDPYMFKYDGYIYHYVAASNKTAPEKARGSVGVARTKDMLMWEILPPPNIEPVSQELECPQVRKIGDYYFLLFSAFSDIFAPQTVEKYGEQIRHGSYVLVGESPLGPFSFIQPHTLLPVSHPQQPYACQFVDFNGDVYLMGTCWNDEQDFLSDPVLLKADGKQLIAQL